MSQAQVWEPAQGGGLSSLGGLGQESALLSWGKVEGEGTGKEDGNACMDFFFPFFSFVFGMACL